MPGGWEGSNRRERLPANWPELVMAVRVRSGGLCEVYSTSRRRICGRPATGGVDHIVPNDDDSLSNLRDTCKYHHSKKSSAEGNEAKAAIKAQRYRPPEPHPGTIRRPKV